MLFAVAFVPETMLLFTVTRYGWSRYVQATWKNVPWNGAGTEGPRCGPRTGMTSEFPSGRRFIAAEVMSRASLDSPRNVGSRFPGGEAPNGGQDPPASGGLPGDG